MKVVVALLAIIGLACAARVLDEHEVHFQAFMQAHNKQYANHREYMHRLAAFKENKARIEELNSNPNDHAVYALNKFSDMYPHEFKQRYLMPSFDATASCQWPYNTSRISLSQAKPPASWDWRTKNVVTPVKDQGQCGSCWSFSVTGNIEGQWALKGNKLTALSEQFLVDCSKSCLGSNPYLCDGGCGGGLPWLAYEDILENNFITTEEAYPYTAMDGTCRNVSTVGAKISNWTALPTDVAAIEAYLVANGPLSITLNANPLMSYSSGIINQQPEDCPGNQSDHAVLLVGYDTDAASGVHYWIVKNSWNTSWGEQGYFRIAAAQGLCGINLCVTTATI